MASQVLVEGLVSRDAKRSWIGLAELGIYLSLTMIGGKILILFCVSLTLNLSVFIANAMEQYTAILLRKQLCTYVQRKYIKYRNYYNLQLSMEVDNPDIRLTTDITQFTQLFSSVIVTLFEALLYIGVSSLLFGWFFSFVVPIAILVFFIVVYIILRFLMNVIGKLVYRQEVMEGNYR